LTSSPIWVILNNAKRSFMNTKEFSQVEAMSKLIDLIYLTSNEPNKWPELLNSMSGYLSRFDYDTPAFFNQSDMLISHLLRSIDLGLKLDDQHAQNMVSSMIIDQLPFGVIITNRKGEIHSSNDHAKQTIKDLPLLTIENNVLRTQSKTKTTLLHKYIKEIGRNLKDEQGISLRLTNITDTKSVSVWVSQINSYNMSDSVKEDLIAIYIISSSVKSPVDPVILQQLYALTPAEALLTKTIANGCHNLVDAADKLQISNHTVRSQMKSIFAKTDCSSQVELVKMILTSPALLAKPKTSHPIAANKSRIQNILIHGRKLSYMEYGNPDAEPLIYCHALAQPTHQLLPDKLCQETSKFRIIVPLRPGFSGSEWRNKKPTLEQHAEDIMSLADQLHIQKFKVLGYSNGAPFASALAFYFPQSTISLHLVAPITPPEFDNWSGLSSSDKYMLRLGKTLPFSTLKMLSHFVLRSMSTRPDEFIARAYSHASPSEKKLLISEDVTEYITL